MFPLNSSIPSPAPLRKAILGGVALSCLFLAGRSGLAAEASVSKPPAVRIASYQGDRAAALSFTFDDGWEDAASIAAPMFDRHGLHATFFIVSGVLSEEDHPQTKNN